MSYHWFSVFYKQIYNLYIYTFVFVNSHLHIILHLRNTVMFYICKFTNEKLPSF